ncbi:MULTISPECIES: SH3 domain-containing protein [Deefgea]|uniref:SH3 domain-containing protein n=1 Tax=Deefgea chitinilytica TaxID=570276 RepID=A0ABS2CF64_9NEIS|nr:MULTISPECIES: SH3 domain-containing protein [Deefgea]MBM5572078.1 SH3 domain-containing protein [Deefgea chitinilytica]MBM9889313.1 SH3 domain-containing protein [Deefgea sp. CFH1-16]
MHKQRINRLAQFALSHRLIAVSLLAVMTSGAHAVEYRSTARHGVIFYDAPADTATKRFILSANIPLEVMNEQGDWIRVRDRDGTLSWIKKSDVSLRRFVQANRLSDVRQAADTHSPILFKVERNVLLERLDTSNTGWVKIKHRDGQTGYIRIEDVWGA